MEIKKSKRADLERGRATRFLLGLILVLALFFAAIEIPFGSSSSPDDPEPLDELFHEDDLIPLTTSTRRELSEPLPKAPKTPETVLVTDGLASEAIPETQPSATDGDDESLPAAVEELPAPTKTDEKPAVANATNDPDKLRVVEGLPEFPGGAGELMKWLTENLKYPKAAQRRRVQGKVVVSFIVNTDGSLSDMKIATSLDPDCDREAMRVMAMMPAWKAGTQNDRPCRTMVAIPIVFKL
ncbi:MAG: TonB family protein [Prevotella sp.]|nr:TonB family protein [Prevotella sp.]